MPANPLCKRKCNKLIVILINILVRKLSDLIRILLK
jgi:hypothetical protein